MATSKAAGRVLYTIKPLLILAAYMGWIVLGVTRSIDWVVVPIFAGFVALAIWLLYVGLRERWKEYPQKERPSHD